MQHGNAPGDEILPVGGPSTTSMQRGKQVYRDFRSGVLAAPPGGARMGWYARGVPGPGDERQDRGAGLAVEGLSEERHEVGHVMGHPAKVNLSSTEAMKAVETIRWVRFRIQDDTRDGVTPGSGRARQVLRALNITECRPPAARRRCSDQQAIETLSHKDLRQRMSNMR